MAVGQGPFCIPYQALVSADLDNLLAADKCFSTSHMANGATRLQPLIFNVGQAAGAAAALSIRLRRPLATLPVRLLQDLLIEEPTAPFRNRSALGYSLASSPLASKTARLS